MALSKRSHSTSSARTVLDIQSVPSELITDIIAYRYLASFSQITLNCVLTDNLLNQPLDLRTAVFSVYNRKIVPMHQTTLVPLPDICSNPPRFTKKGEMYVGIEQMRATVQDLIRENNFELAADLWMHACLGLKRPNLLKVLFIDNRGSYFPFIEANDPNHTIRTWRYVPSSLQYLARLAKNPYPMAEDRYEQMRDYCISKFGKFFSIRSICLEEAIIAVGKSLSKKDRAVSLWNCPLNESAIQALERHYKLDFATEQPPLSKCNSYLEIAARSSEPSNVPLEDHIRPSMKLSRDHVTDLFSELSSDSALRIAGYNMETTLRNLRITSFERTYLRASLWYLEHLHESLDGQLFVSIFEGFAAFGTQIESLCVRAAQLLRIQTTEMKKMKATELVRLLIQPLCKIRIVLFEFTGDECDPTNNAAVRGFSRMENIIHIAQLNSPGSVQYRLLFCGEFQPTERYYQLAGPLEASWVTNGSAKDTTAQH